MRKLLIGEAITLALIASSRAGEPAELPRLNLSASHGCVEIRETSPGVVEIRAKSPGRAIISGWTDDNVTAIEEIEIPDPDDSKIGKLEFVEPKAAAKHARALADRAKRLDDEAAAKAEAEKRAALVARAAVVEQMDRAALVAFALEIGAATEAPPEEMPDEEFRTLLLADLTARGLRA